MSPPSRVSRRLSLAVSRLDLARSISLDLAAVRRRHRVCRVELARDAKVGELDEPGRYGGDIGRYREIQGDAERA